MRPPTKPMLAKTKVTNIQSHGSGLQGTKKASAVKSAPRTV